MVEEASPRRRSWPTSCPTATANSFYGAGQRRPRLGRAGRGRRQRWRSPGRPVVAVHRRRQRDVLDPGAVDGGAPKLPITYVIVNNGSYRIIKQRLVAHAQHRPLRRRWT